MDKYSYNYNFTAPQLSVTHTVKVNNSATKTRFSAVSTYKQASSTTKPNDQRLSTSSTSQTGNLLWTAPPAEQFAFYGMGTVVFYNGQFIDSVDTAVSSESFDARTGTFLWNWTAPFVGLDETAYQYTPYPMVSLQVTDNYTSTQLNTQSTTQSDVTHNSGT